WVHNLRPIDIAPGTMSTRIGYRGVPYEIGTADWWEEYGDGKSVWMRSSKSAEPVELSLIEGSTKDDPLPWWCSYLTKLRDWPPLWDLDFLVTPRLFSSNRF